MLAGDGGVGVTCQMVQSAPLSFQGISSTGLVILLCIILVFTLILCVPVVYISP